MNYEILRTDLFARHLKQLAKKYPSIAADYAKLLIELNTNPLLGKPLGRDCFKIRMKISSKQSGKSGGARVISYVRVQLKKITLLDIYDKSQKDSITDKELMSLLKSIG